jgi:COPII coat assembly protein SEC16
MGGLQVPTPAISHISPMSPNFPSPSITANIPIESLAKWPETAAVMVSSPMVPDTSAALTALGDYMVSNGWVEAAHAW